MSGTKRVITLGCRSPLETMPLQQSGTRTLSHALLLLLLLSLSERRSRIFSGIEEQIRRIATRPSLPPRGPLAHQTSDSLLGILVFGGGPIVAGRTEFDFLGGDRSDDGGMGGVGDGLHHGVPRRIGREVIGVPQQSAARRVFRHGIPEFGGGLMVRSDQTPARIRIRFFFFAFLLLLLLLAYLLLAKNVRALLRCDLLSSYQTPRQILLRFVRHVFRNLFFGDGGLGRMLAFASSRFGPVESPG
mmetsp:Transcript_34067/g.62785  ORF Transcript_34067/g.62785 Transcript_34067/m.62785 type:complete len:245 (+) Transcript_34067:329-1063(+)